MSKSFEEYFESKGAVELFCVIHPLGSGFEELLDDVPVSRGTLNTRLKEGEELGLVAKTLVSGENDPLELWVPTERGMGFYEELRARQIPPRFKKYRNAVQTFEDEREAFVTYVERSDDSEWEGLDETPYTKDEE